MSIIELIFDILFGIINIFLSIIPVISLPSTFTDGVNTVSANIATLSWLIPMKTVLQLTLVWIPLWILAMYFKEGNWIIRNLPIIRAKKVSVE